MIIKIGDDSIVFLLEQIKVRLFLNNKEINITINIVYVFIKSADIFVNRKHINYIESNHFKFLKIEVNKY